MKRILIVVLLTTALCFLAIAGLWFYALPHFNNGFNRHMAKTDLQLKNVIQLPSASFDFSGKLENHMILRDLGEKGAVYSLDDSLVKLKILDLNLPRHFGTTKGYVNIILQSSQLLWSNGKSGELIARSGHGMPSRSYHIKNMAFDQSSLLSEQSIIVRAKNSVNGKKQRELVKIGLKADALAGKKFLLNGQMDGFFSTDGWMAYEPVQAKLVYMYYYRGEFLCLDTNLNLHYTAKTIDTIRNAKIKLTKISTALENGGELERITQTGPPPIVNRYHTVYSDKIFISSAIKADNESFFTFRKNQVIDTYSLLNGKYLSSFYIPNYKGYKVKQFRIEGRTIFALFDRYLIIFKITSPDLALSGLP